MSQSKKRSAKRGKVWAPQPLTRLPSHRRSYACSMQATSGVSLEWSHTSVVWQTNTREIPRYLHVVTLYKGYYLAIHSISGIRRKGVDWNITEGGLVIVTTGSFI